MWASAAKPNGAAAVMKQEHWRYRIRRARLIIEVSSGVGWGIVVLVMVDAFPLLIL